MDKFRPGVGGAPEFPPTPVLLSKAKLHHSNILVGDDPIQVRFAEQITGVSCQHTEQVRDEDVLQDQSTLYQVLTSKAILISPQLRLRVGIWSLSPITKGSAAATAVVKAAADMLNVKLDREKTQRASDILTEEPIGDIRAALWYAVWIVADEIPEEPGFWPDPWSGKNWIPKSVDPQYRLNALYRELVGYVWVHDKDEQAARRFGVSPAKVKRLKSMSLNMDRVYSSLIELSKWRQHKDDPYLCALKISMIWKQEY